VNTEGRIELPVESLTGGANEDMKGGPLFVGIKIVRFKVLILMHKTNVIMMFYALARQRGRRLFDSFNVRCS
jgi:hypothetical protein